MWVAYLTHREYNPSMSVDDAPEWAARIERGLVRISTVTRLEIGFTGSPVT